VPQWNCGCANCRAARAGDDGVAPRSQESVAVTADGVSWALLNASPDVREQLAAAPPLRPRTRRDSPIAAVILTSGELDHTLGLLTLRESQPLAVYATGAVMDGFLRGNALYGGLERWHAWRRLALGRAEDVRDAAGRTTGLAVEARAVPGKVPRHLEGRRAPHVEDVVALRITDGDGRVLAYCPGAARVDDGVRAALAGADCIFFDGTFWSSDELARAGVGTRPAESMAHAPLAGADGSLAALEDLGARRRVLIHLNNTNPLLRRDAPERGELRGWEIADDGMELDA
jgi:pyrroloquinoline quinone biosynthesis protein B